MTGIFLFSLTGKFCSMILLETYMITNKIKDDKKIKFIKIPNFNLLNFITNFPKHSYRTKL